MRLKGLRRYYDATDAGDAQDATMDPLISYKLKHLPTIKCEFELAAMLYLEPEIVAIVSIALNR